MITDKCFGKKIIDPTILGAAPYGETCPARNRFRNTRPYILCIQTTINKIKPKLTREVVFEFRKDCSLVEHGHAYKAHNQ